MNDGFFVDENEGENDKWLSYYDTFYFIVLIFDEILNFLS